MAARMEGNISVRDGEPTKGGTDLCPCKTHESIECRHCGFLVLLLGFLMGAGITFPYIAAMAMKLMPAFLPFISRAAGTPPQTGIMAMFLIPLPVIGLIIFPLLKESIDHRNASNCKRIRVVNKISLYIVIICFIGCCVVASYPMGNTDVPSAYDWMVLVILEHMVGAFLTFCTLAFYQILQAWLWWELKDTSKRDKYMKIGISVLYLVLFLTSLKPGYDFGQEQFGPDPLNIEKLKRLIYTLPKEFSTSYCILSVSEWILCIASILNILSLYKDFQRISFRLTLRPKTCVMKHSEDSKNVLLNTLSV